MFECFTVPGPHKTVNARIKYFTSEAETIFQRPFGREKRADKDCSSRRFEINIVCKHTFENSPDTADFAYRFMCYVNDVSLAIHCRCLSFQHRCCIYFYFFLVSFAASSFFVFSSSNSEIVKSGLFVISLYFLISRAVGFSPA
ncbi:MAG: hypothetical protein BWY69_01449 [Planctomycetes bacterium ADurb.Bin401]|nr:MAG: hypothetical protein BWY69_01449 [Planctomycetes bacterium ADurb.Bin401]